jgi:hypothetical protein
MSRREEKCRNENGDVLERKKKKKRRTGDGRKKG